MFKKIRAKVAEISKNVLPVVRAKREGNFLHVKIRKTRSRVERLIVFTLIILLIVIQINSLFGYLSFFTIIALFIIYLVSVEILTIDLGKSTISKKTAFLDRDFFEDYHFELQHPLVINFIKYNNAVDGEAFNFYRSKFYIEYRNKFILFTSDDSDVYEELNKFFKTNETLFNGEPIRMNYKGLVEMDIYQRSK